MSKHTSGPGKVGGLLEALKDIIRLEQKSILADCAYQGIPPKTWAREQGRRYEGYNECLKRIQDMARAAIEKASQVGNTAGD